MKELEVFRQLAKKARPIQKEPGILTEPKVKTGKMLPQQKVVTLK